MKRQRRGTEIVAVFQRISDTNAAKVLHTRLKLFSEVLPLLQVTSKIYLLWFIMVSGWNPSRSKAVPSVNSVASKCVATVRHFRYLPLIETGLRGLSFGFGFWFVFCVWSPPAFLILGGGLQSWTFWPSSVGGVGCVHFQCKDYLCKLQDVDDFRIATFKCINE